MLIDSVVHRMKRLIGVDRRPRRMSKKFQHFNTFFALKDFITGLQIDIADLVLE